MSYERTSERLSAALRAVRCAPGDLTAWADALQAARQAGYGLACCGDAARGGLVEGISDDERECDWLLLLVEGYPGALTAIEGFRLAGYHYPGGRAVGPHWPELRRVAHCCCCMGDTSWAPSERADWECLDCGQASSDADLLRGCEVAA